MNNILKDCREKLEKGISLFGPFMKTGDPAFVEASAYAGFDFVILDMEHGPNSLETMQNLVRAALVAGTLPVIRVRDRMPESVSQALDIGALGIQVPQITNAEEVRSIISAARFSPEGQRGVCRFVRAAAYSSIPPSEYFREANHALIILQVEGREAIKNIDSILDEKGYDILFIGPYDLSQALDVPGQINHPIVIAEVKNLIAKSASRGRNVGIFSDNISTAIEWKKLGVRYISYSVDVGIYYSACSDLRKKLDEN